MNAAHNYTGNVCVWCGFLMSPEDERFSWRVCLKCRAEADAQENDFAPERNKPAQTLADPSTDGVGGVPGWTISKL